MKLIVAALLTVTNTLAVEKKPVRNSDRFELVCQLTLPELNAAAKLWIPLARPDTHQKAKSANLDQRLQLPLPAANGRFPVRGDGGSVAPCNS